MDYGKLSQFVRDHGSVTVLSAGTESKLRSGDLDSIDLVEKAEKFQFGGKWYTKADFEKLIDSSK